MTHKSWALAGVALALTLTACGEKGGHDRRPDRHLRRQPVRQRSARPSRSGSSAPSRSHRARTSGTGLCWRPRS